MKTNTAKRLLASVAIISAATSFSSLAAAQSTNHLQAKKANVFTGTETAGFAQVSVSDFIAAQTGVQANLVTVSSFTGRNGVEHQRMHQTVDGLRVHGSYVKAAKRNGSISHMIERTSPANGRKVKARISADAAIDIAVASNFGAGKAADFFYRAPTAEKVYVGRNNGNLQEGFLVENWSQADNRLYHTLVDGNGGILDNELRTNEDSYNIFADHPGVSSQTVVSDPADATASPDGWLSGAQTTLTIRGNNASAYLDRDNNGSSDGGGSAVTDGNFTAEFFENQQPTFAENQEVAVQNLFYLNNLIHDQLYGHGFVEGTGNFQEDNFGNGGAGGDSVNAEAQDGGGTNNANFATPSDGSNPRMQMYLWTLTNPNRDGDLDSDIIWHEYGHGLTWRMIGNMSGSVSGAIGEGMSDVLGILKNNEDRVGEYSTNDPDGIRSEPYTNYSRTIGDFTGSSVHFDGEIYAATIWRLAQLSNADGIDNDAVLDVLVDGMNFTPSQPDYLEMRDGILAASPAEYECTVWQAFADFGMGDGATFGSTINESFSIPTSCSGGGGDPKPTTTSSVDGLTATGAITQRRKWTATATASIVDDTGAPISGVTVAGEWNTARAVSCVTSASGTCSVEVPNLRHRKNTFATFTIQTLDGAEASGSPLSVTVDSPF